MTAGITGSLQARLSPHVTSMSDVLKWTAASNIFVNAHEINESIGYRECGERKLHIAEIGSIEMRI